MEKLAATWTSVHLARIAAAKTQPARILLAATPVHASLVTQVTDFRAVTSTNAEKQVRIAAARTLLVRTL